MGWLEILAECSIQFRHAGFHSQGPFLPCEYVKTFEPWTHKPQTADWGLQEGLRIAVTRSENPDLAQVTHDKAMDECTLHLSLSETLDGEDGSGLLFVAYLKPSKPQTLNP